MAFDNSFTAVTGATYTAAQYNTYTKGNFASIWVGTNAGDMDYYTSAFTKARLGLGGAGATMYSTGSAPAWLPLGAAKKILSSTGSAPAWSGFGGLGFKVDWHASAVGHTYSIANWRDMPNSSKNVTVDVQSTLFCIGYVSEYATDTPNYYGFFDCYFHIDGQDTTGLTTIVSYAKDNTPKMVIGYKPAVAAGSRVIKLREYCGAGSYAVTQLAWMVAIIPDGS